MEEKKIRYIEKSVEAWGFGTQQDFANLVNNLEKHNIPIEEFIGYVESKKKLVGSAESKLRNITEGQNKKLFALTPRCPDCSNILTIDPITRENEKGNKSMWRCSKCKSCSEKYIETDPEDECKYFKFDKRTIQEIQEYYQNEVKKILADNQTGDK